MTALVDINRDHPHEDRDQYWIDENLEYGRTSLARIPARYRDATVTVPPIVAWVRELVALAAPRLVAPPSIRRGPSLLLLGATGTGKTHQAYGAIRALALSGVRCGWSAMTAADIYARLRPRHGIDTEKEFNSVARCGFLLIDDLGAAKASDWTEEVNYRLINTRYEARLPTLITSNVGPKELARDLGDRVASRLIEMCRRVVLDGPDRRRNPSQKGNR